MKKFVSIALSVVMAAGVFSIVPTSASAAGAKVSLKKSSATLKIEKKKGKTVYGSAKIRLKKSKGVSVKKITYKSADGKIAKVSKKGKVTACKKGDVKISVNVRYTFNKKSFNKKLTFKVKVKDTRKKAKKVNKPAVIVTPATEKQLATEATEPETVTETEAATVPETTAPLTEATEATIASTGYAEATEDSQPATSEDVWGDTNHCVQDVSQPESYGGDDIQGDTSHCEITPPSYNPNPYPAGVVTDPYGYTFAPQETEPTTVAATATEAATEATIPAPANFEEKLSAFSNRLYSMCVEEEEENYVMSPVSVYMAISMLYSIGDDDVRDEIKELVGMEGSDFERMGDLFLSLSRTYKKNDANGGDPITVGEVNLSNSIWLDNDVEASADALKELADKYYCETHNAPFKSDNETANEMVREFVKEQTHGLIDKDFNLSADTFFALINTLYFKDVWSMSSGELETEMRDFYSANGSVNCEFLDGYYFDGKVQETESCYYFYTEMAHGYKIKFVVPKEDHALSEAMSAANLYKVNQTKDYQTYENVYYNPYEDYDYGFGDVEEGYYDNYLEDCEVHHYTRCIFPSFKIESDTDLKEILKNNGYLEQAFDENIGFETSINDNIRFFINKFLQSAVIDVQKDGVKAAAVTIIESDMCTSAAPEPEQYHDFIIDRSFGFIVTDSDDTILFEGKVLDPTL